MSKFKSEKVLPRYLAVAVLLTLIGVAVIVKAGYTMTAKKSYWETVANRQKSDSDSVRPNRGNILSCDGQLLASSIPEYKIFMDYQAGGNADTVWVRKRDSIWYADLDSLCRGLNVIFPERSAEEFKARLEEGKHKIMRNGSEGARHWAVWPKRISYNTYCEVKQLPFFNLPSNKGGFHAESFEARRRPFGSLAERTIGDIRSFEGGKDTARFGIELSYDSLLRGKYGIERKQKVLNKVVPFTLTPAVDGTDVVTTIDVGMQDLAEQALIEGLKKWDASMGVTILMEVKTGDIKAIVNMRRAENGQYYERFNDAISYRCEPGSVFKVASFLVALDDGVVDTSYVIHTGCGILNMHGAKMKDHNWHRGGYGDINVARALEVSSNIGVSYVIDHYYGSNPRKYVEGLYRVGIGQDLKLPIVGYLPPKIRMPDTKTSNRALYWSKTTLPWMSIGYETQIAPINTVTFYNAIANNGKMMRPRFVKGFMREGQMIAETQPEVIKEQIAKPSTIKTMQTVLRHVVSQGLGKKAGSHSFQVSGKTGTAQVAKAGGYKTGTTEYWLSFCGYFPSDNPQYTCIVCIKKMGLPASGGLMSGGIFHHISEGVMAKSLKLSVTDARDSTSVLIPSVLKGDNNAAGYVLRQLGVNTSKVSMASVDVKAGKMPDVTGMGARDAVYQLERLGVKVKLSGKGFVARQSIAPGTTLQTGMSCMLELK
ncbi:PASTA domain-containing protein [Prevotella communis]|uniref:penicillin-binding protein n=1 Tax=Prevotella communis TaxID=2913614 RepID=UPI001EDB2F5A|nr:penicillin-binding protein [Prevotella communis]UKK59730.1 PASTA domain-containing protein [Prevotella communis]UKK62477.1 PASTA domain-containing protein [Prevotella communis]UKK65301.1 PASTA domain-containing protein [Prevotella communis]UKK67714.1 PASTA domain-containing protein [Prevotella communis]UKK70139.1 PASTA domain-containing protein [Prevotella communis]